MISLCPFMFEASLGYRQLLLVCRHRNSCLSPLDVSILNFHALFFCSSGAIRCCLERSCLPPYVGHAWT
ncbi:hypothetical protein L596_021691 [Steinernema carpocapsae]|uniref:Uncharacterized protein n=1 Tax=Steinernema carpocapsae TaxID=34508 RepID=A0A4U5MJK0_STECR|nr:hypothetical protein L596_021691 [Steinernema carpocapsae]